MSGDGEDDLCRFLALTINSLGRELAMTPETARNLAASLIAKIKAKFGPGTAYIPAASRAPRDSQILQDHDAGLSNRAIAKKHGIHPSTALRIVQRHRLPEPTSRRPTQGAGLGRDGWNL